MTNIYIYIYIHIYIYIYTHITYIYIYIYIYMYTYKLPRPILMARIRGLRSVPVERVLSPTGTYSDYHHV